MKKIEINDDVYEKLTGLADRLGRNPNDVLTLLLSAGAIPDAPDQRLVSLVLESEFRTNLSDADRYLSILSWVATNHESELKEFIRSLSFGSSGRRYLGLSHEEIVEQCRDNQAQQIPHTQYWAIMNIDIATKRKFLSRVLEFVGYDHALIDFVCSVIGHRIAPNRRVLSIA